MIGAAIRERVREEVLVRHLCGLASCLPREIACSLEVLRRVEPGVAQADVAEHRLGFRAAKKIVLVGGGERFVRHRDGGVVVALGDAEYCRQRMGQRPERMRGRAVDVGGAVREQEQAPVIPQPRLFRECGRQSKRGVDVPGVHRPGGRGPDVVEVGLSSLLPCQLVGAHQPRADTSGKLDEVREVRVAGGGALPTGIELFECVLPDRLEEPVPRGLELVVDIDERLVDEPGEHVEHVRLEGHASCDGLGGLQREPAREHRDAREHRSLVFVEQVVRPVDGRAQRLMARQSPATATG